MFIHDKYLFCYFLFFFFFFNDTATTEIYTLSLHDALPIFRQILGIDVADRALVDDAQAGAEVIAGIDPLYLALLDADRLVALALDEELDEIGARSQRAFDHAVHQGLLEQWHQLECTGLFRRPRLSRGKSRISSSATASSGLTLPSARHRMSAPSMAASVAVAMGVARREGTPAPSSCSASTATHERNVARTTAIRSFSPGTVSIATPATTQPAEPPEATTTWRHMAMKRSRTADGLVGASARRCARRRSDVHWMASSASCLFPSGKW